MIYIEGVVEISNKEITFDQYNITKGIESQIETCIAHNSKNKNNEYG